MVGPRGLTWFARGCEGKVMAQVITCPSCKQQLQVPEEFLGQPVKCPGCGVAFLVTAGSSAGGAPVPPPLPTATVPMAPPAVPGPTAIPPFGPWGESPRPRQRGVDETRAAASLAAPAMCMLLIGGLGFLCTGFQILTVKPADPGAVQEFARRFGGDDPEARELFVKGFEFAQGPGGTALRVFFLFHSLLIIAGALAMMNRRLYGLAVIGSLASMIYINYCCCLLGFPLGLWAMLVLMSPEVRDSFQ